MDMPIARLAATVWRQITDLRGFAMRTVWLFAHGSRNRPGSPFNSGPQRLPPLDWPPDLFDDELLCH